MLNSNEIKSLIIKFIKLKWQPHTVFAGDFLIEQFIRDNN